MPQNTPQGQVTTTSALRRGGTIFAFEVLNPGSTSGEKVSFPAYIDSISDSFSPSWGQYNDMGRADPKVMYQSFGRSISVNFKVVALQREGDESTFNIFANKLNILAKAVHPHYVGGKGFVGRFIKFSIAKLYSNEYGYISALNVDISNDTPWDTTIEGSGERPIVATVAMSIYWIGNKRPDAGKSLSYSTIPDQVVNIQTLGSGTPIA